VKKDNLKNIVLINDREFASSLKCNLYYNDRYLEIKLKENTNDLTMISYQSPSVRFYVNTNSDRWVGYALKYYSRRELSRTKKWTITKYIFEMTNTNIDVRKEELDGIVKQIKREDILSEILNSK
jgi:hypothetical protein